MTFFENISGFSQQTTINSLLQFSFDVSLFSWTALFSSCWLTHHDVTVHAEKSDILQYMKLQSLFISVNSCDNDSKTCFVQQEFYSTLWPEPSSGRRGEEMFKLFCFTRRTQEFKWPSSICLRLFESDIGFKQAWGCNCCQRIINNILSKHT